MNDEPDYRDDSANVLRAEQKKLFRDKRPDNLTGLALSGGGIRSACFALGVVHALLNAKRRSDPKRPLLTGFHYLSTVSGGGYLGATLIWLRRQIADNGGLAELERQLDRHHCGAKSAGRRRWLDYIRLHGNYLLPRPISLLDQVGVVLRCMVFSVAVYGGMLVVLLASLVHLGLIDNPGWTHPADDVPPASGIFRLAQVFLHLGRSMSGVFSLLALFILILFVLFSVATRWTGTDQQRPWHYRCRTCFQQATGALLACLIVLGTLASLHPVFEQLARHPSIAPLAGTVSSLIGLYQAALGRGERKNRFDVPAPLLILASGVLLYVLVLLAYYIQWKVFGTGGSPWHLALFAIVVASLVIFNDLNYLGLGRMYRDRLMETFMPGADAVIDNKWDLARDADRFKMADAMPIAAGQSTDDCWLYPLVNCTAVLVDSHVDLYRNRGGDSFILSPLWCGSDATGWIDTTRFADGKLTYASAVAASAAAVNPHAGGNGSGVTRDRLVAMLMYLFQIRLGLWVLSPRITGGAKARAGKPQRMIASLFGQHPNLLIPGLMSGLFGRRQSEHSAYLELTDGGHFDNSGIYELFRRRTNLIVLAQGSADPGYRMEDLANALRKAQIDFGVEVEFADDYGLDRLLPGKPDAKTGLNYAERGFALATIHYPLKGEEGEVEGHLVYLQATRLQNLLRHKPGVIGASASDVCPPASVLSFALSHPDFPNQTTLDQFFGEAEVEAYRELGYYTAKEALYELGLLPLANAPAPAGFAALVAQRFR